jgi:excisionase family DNA binding protein
MSGELLASSPLHTSDVASRTKQAAPGLGVRSQLGLFEILEAEPAEPTGPGQAEGAREVQRGARSSSAKLRSLRQARDGRGALPRLCVKPDEAAQMLGVSRDYFDEHVKPELRIVRRGSRTILIPVAELVRWLERNAARWA